MYTNEQALENKDFLQKLCTQQISTRFVKIIALDINEYPLEEIQGQVTQGSISIDGKSIVRRTCSLTLITTNKDFDEQANWALHTKMQLFVGLKNTINNTYPPIIWFKMGTYILTSFSASIQDDGTYSISLQGKDKMCLLNGDVGGNLTALSYDFANITIDEEDGSSSTEAIPLKRIIREAVHTYAKEPYHNIIINDLDDYGLELLEYRGDQPLIYEVDKESRQLVRIITDFEQQYYHHTEVSDPQSSEVTLCTIQDLINGINNLKFNTFETISPASIEGTNFYFTRTQDQSADQYYLIQITAGMTCGYRNTELVYAGDLTAAVGDPITKVLTSIRDMLSDFEYFYNLDGQFVFQKQATSIYTVWNNVHSQNNLLYVEPGVNDDQYVFKFQDNQQVTSFDNNVDINNIKNDFSIWGTKEGIGGGDVPIHMRYAIHKKPKHYITWGTPIYTLVPQNNFDRRLLSSYYVYGENGYQLTTDTAIDENQTYYTMSYQQEYYTTDADSSISLPTIVVDWREIIYRMALDWEKYHELSNGFYATISRNNSKWYPDGVTGYEQYYTDMLAFWRDLYNPDQTTQYEEINLSKFDYDNSAKNYAHQWFYQDNNSSYKPVTLQTVPNWENYDPLYTKFGHAYSGDDLAALSNEEKKKLYYRQTTTIHKDCVVRAHYNTYSKYYTKDYQYQRLPLTSYYLVPNGQIFRHFKKNRDGQYLYNSETSLYYIPEDHRYPANIGRFKPQNVFKLSVNGEYIYKDNMYYIPEDEEYPEGQARYDSVQEFIQDTTGDYFAYNYSNNDNTANRARYDCIGAQYIKHDNGSYTFGIPANNYYPEGQLRYKASIGQEFILDAQGSYSFYTPLNDQYPNNQPRYAYSQSFTQNDEGEYYYEEYTDTYVYDPDFLLPEETRYHRECIITKDNEGQLLVKNPTESVSGADFPGTFKMTKGYAFTHDYDGEYLIRAAAEGDTDRYSPTEYKYIPNNNGEYALYIPKENPINGNRYTMAENEVYGPTDYLPSEYEQNDAGLYTFYIPTNNEYPSGETRYQESTDDEEHIYYIPSPTGIYLLRTITSDEYIDANQRYSLKPLPELEPGDYSGFGQVITYLTEAPINEQTYNDDPFNTYYIISPRNGKLQSVLPTVRYDEYDETATYTYKTSNDDTSNDDTSNDDTLPSISINSADKYKYYIEALGYILSTTKTTSDLYPIQIPDPAYNENYTYYQKIASNYIHDNNSQYYGWDSEIVNNPEETVFWIDFLDPTGTEFEKYSVDQTGSRSKSVKEEKVTSIYFNDILPVILVGTNGEDLTTDQLRQGYVTMQVPAKYADLFSIASQGKSAFDVVNSFLNEYTHLAENVSLNIAPLYFLQPNSRIYINDTQHNIKGDYTIEKLTIPLQPNGQMSLTANKIIPLNFG